MPAAAVIPAPLAYIKVVAVKKLVVELRGARGGPSMTGTSERALPVGGSFFMERAVHQSL